MKKERLSIEDHRRIAAELFQVRDLAMKNLSVLSGAYPFASRQVKQIERVLKATDAVRCKLDDEYCREYPEPEARKPHQPWTYSPYYA